MGVKKRLKFVQKIDHPVDVVSVWDGTTFDTSWQNNTTVDGDGYTVAHITTAEQAVTLWSENVVYNWQNSVSNHKVKIILDTSVEFNANPDNWTNHPSESWQYPMNTTNQGEFILDGNYHSIIGLFCQTPGENRACFFNIETNSTIKNIRFHKCSSSVNSGNARGNIGYVFSSLTLENVIFDRLYLYNRGSSYCQVGVNHWNGSGNTIHANNVVFSNVTVDITRSPSNGNYSLLGGSITDWGAYITQYLVADNIIYHNCSASTATVYLFGNKSGMKTPTADEYQVTNAEYLDINGLTANYGTAATNLSSMVSDYNSIADEDINSTGDGFDAQSGPVEYFLLVPSSISVGKPLLYEDTTVDPYNPLGLPPFTIRVKIPNGFTPTQGTVVLVDQDQHIWDITYELVNGKLPIEYNVRRYMSELLGANTSGVTDFSSAFNGADLITTVPLFDTSSCTNMSYMFSYCSSLTTVPLFDTSSCTNMQGMFNTCGSLTSVPLFDTSSCTNMGSIFSDCSSLTTVPLFDTSSCTSMMNMFIRCSSLTTVPLFDTSSCTDMRSMLYNCTNVQSGALAIYQQASTQANPPTNHSSCFTNCGSNTVTGAAELAQIPQDWGGTMS